MKYATLRNAIATSLLLGASAFASVGADPAPVVIGEPPPVVVPTMPAQSEEAAALAVQRMLAAAGDAPTPVEDAVDVAPQNITGLNVVFVHHGESEWSAKKLAGATNDTADVLLTASGARDCRAAGVQLKELLKDKQVALLTSNLARAQLSGVIATDGLVVPSITSSLQDTSVEKDSESTLPPFQSRELQTIEFERLTSAGFAPDMVERISARYAAAQMNDNKGNHNAISRGKRSYLDHFPKYVVKAFVGLAAPKEDAVIVLAGHSHWWGSFAAKYDTDKTCRAIRSLRNGQAISFQFSSEVKTSASGPDYMTFTIGNCQTVFAGSGALNGVDG